MFDPGRSRQLAARLRAKGPEDILLSRLKTFPKIAISNRIGAFEAAR